MKTITIKNLIYTVQSGDTLYSIARQYGSSASLIEKVNHLYPPVTDAGLVFPGDVIVVPILKVVSNTYYRVKRGDTLTQIASKWTTFVDLVAGINGIANPNNLIPGQQLLVPALITEIQTGDTLFGIAQRYGVPLEQIVKANQGRPGFQPDPIWPDYYLIVPIPNSRNIYVSSPLPASKIVNGSRTTGKARVFEANVLYQVRDDHNAIVSKERFTTADHGAPVYGSFSAVIPFDKPPTIYRGFLWVYSRSAKDGSIQDLVKTRVYF